jgi:hypothetical protein
MKKDVTSKATKEFKYIRAWFLFFVIFLCVAIGNFVTIWYSFFKSPVEFISNIYLVKVVTLLIDIAGIIAIIGAVFICGKNGH